MRQSATGTARRVLALGAIVAGLLLAGCSGSNDLADASAEAENPAEDEATAEDVDPSGSDAADDELGFSDPDRGDPQAGNPDPEQTGLDNRGSNILPDGPLPEVPTPELAEPEDLLPELEAEVGEAVKRAAESPDVAILDVADLPDVTPTDEEIASFGDGRRRTPTGKLIVLDELASLACANVEIALGAIDEGDLSAAGAQIATAGERAGQSELESIESWSVVLTEAGAADSIDVTTLVGFLSVCLEGGYVI